MNRERSSLANERPVVIGYQVPGLGAVCARKSRSKRKLGFPGFRIRMTGHYVEQIRAAAQCAGWTLSQFLYHALLQARDEVAKEVGLRPEDLDKLSDRERVAVCRKYRAVMSVERIWPAQRN